MNEKLIAELVNLYHTARIALSGCPCGRWERMCWASREFSKAHPEFKEITAYKALDRALWN